MTESKSIGHLPKGPGQLSDDDIYQLYVKFCCDYVDYVSRTDSPEERTALSEEMEPISREDFHACLEPMNPEERDKLINELSIGYQEVLEQLRTANEKRWRKEEKRDRDSGMSR